ncbi:DUF4097 domain-containing protein [Pedobacter polaris]|uniref:DUF4097 domain-containing protein n=1 Tax=Pedobacter polaris TaxID=2571273 RepID=A0A4U1CV19_9SPHI|nr:DUF4097 family beta strand repeat-containing protein [Pedobacter polaris]TKC10009.1 DUF4097 domain-containing protein [Pedobacter polaris]
MKKQSIILITLLCASLFTNAQKEFRLSKSTGQLKLNINGAIIEGYDGKEVIFSSKDAKIDEVDERAKGLVAVSGSGYTDNTGMGISVTENGQEALVNMVSKKPIGIITIKVPQNMKVSFTNNSTLYSDELFIKDIKGEIEVSTTYNKVKLENNTGPMNIKTIHSPIDATFNSELKGPISIISIYGYVDVAMPSSSKANIELGTSYGKLYAGKEFKIDFEKTESDRKTDRGIYTINGAQTTSGSITTKTESGSTPARATGGTIITSGNGLTYSIGTYGSGDQIKGKLNGGGIDFIFKSTYKNVYLREK